MTGAPVTVVNIRANRSPPGLRAQHVAAVEAAAAVGDAEVEGASIDARRVTFRPRAAATTSNVSTTSTRAAARAPRGPSQARFGDDRDPRLPPALAAWSIAGNGSGALTLRVEVKGTASLVHRHHAAGGAGRVVHSVALTSSGPVELALLVGWNEVTLQASGARASQAETRHVVRLPPDLAPARADGPWLEVVRVPQDDGDVDPDRLILMPPGPTTTALRLEQGLVRVNEAQTVTVPDPYFLGRFEVNRRQFRAARLKGGFPVGMTELASQDPPDVDRDDLPVVRVAHPQAAAYCALRGLRLPTYAEWERAFRAGEEDRRYPWGPAWDPTRVNRREDEPGESTLHEADVDGYPETLAPVRALPAGMSLHGALNLAGNASEWVAALDIPGDQRAVRLVFKYGGACDTADARLTWPGYVSEKAPDDSLDDTLGLRVARSVDLVP